MKITYSFGEPYKDLEFKEISVNGRIEVGEDAGGNCYVSCDMIDEGVCWIEPRDIGGVIDALKQFQEYKRGEGMKLHEYLVKDGKVQPVSTEVANACIRLAAITCEYMDKIAWKHKDYETNPIYDKLEFIKTKLERAVQHDI